MNADFFKAAKHCISLPDPASKCAAVVELANAMEASRFEWDHDSAVEPIGAPGRPALPELVEAFRVPRRRLGSAAGRTALIHAIAHIEFNAINLALDAAYRFRHMPPRYYSDWVSVARDESKHFQLLEKRLKQLGSGYGHFPAHNGLWEMAEKTAGRCLVRMALVPRVLEARGLDVTPGMIEKLCAAGDAETVAILEIILAEEIGHVAIGTQWFRYCCEQEGAEPLTTFLDLLKEYYPGSLRGPFNTEARLEAGFSPEEMQALTAGFEG
jgi:uncharacterized ferritin-like protein (DUF455 family)